MANDELIRKKDALDALMAERKHLLANGQKGAEHILTHHGYNVIDELKPVQSDVPDMNVGDMISREAALDAFNVLCQEHRYKIPGKRETYSQYNEAWQDALDRAEGAIFNLPPVRTEIIHCKDCAFYEKEIGGNDGFALGMCRFIEQHYVTNEGFCFWAKKRGDLGGAD